MCQDAAVMLAALGQVEARPFRLLRLKNNLASEKKPFNLHAVLEYTTKAVGVPLVVEVRCCLTTCSRSSSTRQPRPVYRARSFAERRPDSASKAAVFCYLVCYASIVQEIPHAESDNPFLALKCRFLDF